MTSQHTRRTFATAAAALLALATAAIVVLAGAAAVQAANTYHRQRQALDAELRAAAGQGFTADDLAPITNRLRALDTSEPRWAGGLAPFEPRRSEELARLRADLRARQQQVLSQAQLDVGIAIDGGRQSVEQDRELGADEPDLEAIQKRLDDGLTASGPARTLWDYRSVLQQVRAAAGDAALLGSQVQAENGEVLKAAEDLKSQTGGSLDAVHRVGADAVARGRNDASVAAYMNKSNPFKTFDQLSKAYSRLEKFAGRAGSPDLQQAAVGTAGVQRYAGQVHDLLIASLPSKAIVVSHEAQQLWAYQEGKVVQETLVTTGRPALPTDIGPMKVLSKSSPWKMHSPWPKGSPAWYPDTVVQMVLWFTNTGEGLHDAYWQRCCYGPGSEYSGSASHGCIHVPFGAEQYLFSWAEVGTPVIVYPGDGAPVAKQLSEITTDDQGNPLHGP
jgi:lipoprotein-anchoring transpeptidase ErfK/SrfK